jgi:hypothetical protein
MSDSVASQLRGSGLDFLDSSKRGIVYLPVKAGGGTKKKKAKNTTANETKKRISRTKSTMAMIQGEAKFALKIQKRKKELRRRKCMEGSCRDGGWTRTLFGVTSGRRLTSAVGGPIRGRCIRSWPTPVLIPSRVIPSTVPVPWGVVIHRRL